LRGIQIVPWRGVAAPHQQSLPGSKKRGRLAAAPETIANGGPSWRHLFADARQPPNPAPAVVLLLADVLSGRILAIPQIAALGLRQVTLRLILRLGACNPALLRAQPETLGPRDLAGLAPVLDAVGLLVLSGIDAVGGRRCAGRNQQAR